VRLAREPADWQTKPASLPLWLEERLR